VTAYYNEIDPYCVRWLRNLISEGLIADGHVDDRSIQEVTPNDLRGYAQCHFFAGFGGWPAALRRSGVWPDHRPVWTGSCPCQPFSVAGKQAGFADERHLWPAWHWLIEQCRPATVFGEQVASASQWLGLVRRDLEALEYSVGVMPIEAASAGADHLRDRYWFVGHDTRQRRGEGRTEPEVHERGRAAVAGDGGASGMANSDSPAIRHEPGRGSGTNGAGSGIDCDNRERLPQQSERCGGDAELEWVLGADGKARRVKSGVRLLAHGVPQRVAKLRALGNAIDFRPAAAFIKAASESIA
jgi:DNA (cytosine-5)-methyltransferase 1